MTKKLVLFDLDNTLIDSGSFRRSLYPQIFSILQKNNKAITMEEIEKMVHDFIQNTGLFDPEKLVEIIGKDLDKKNKEMVRVLFYDSEAMKNFFYDEVMEEIGKFSEVGEVGVLSQGVAKYQLAKFKSILHHFHPERIHIEEDKKSKMEEILTKYSKYKVYYVDDLKSMLEKAKQIKNDIITLWIKRPNPRVDTSEFVPDREINNLKEAYEYIKNS